MNKEAGGVVLAFAGFVFLVGAFKGTWRNAADALLGRASSSSSSAGAPASRPASSGLPGSAPVPARGAGNGSPFSGALR